MPKNMSWWWSFCWRRFCFLVANNDKFHDCMCRHQPLRKPVVCRIMIHSFLFFFWGGMGIGQAWSFPLEGSILLTATVLYKAWRRRGILGRLFCSVRTHLKTKRSHEDSIGEYCPLRQGIQKFVFQEGIAVSSYSNTYTVFTTQWNLLLL